jgi:predicted acyltransferase
MNPIWFLRMARWAKKPPSEARVKMVLAIIAICLLIFGYEWLFGWPDWLTPNQVPRGRIKF